ncbi:MULTISPECIES: type II toxin-antitoxin system Phd/YefM family antitoxin [unclassified Frankia]|uniref:type II toxin-antitoxin system Phd/YefM family antitoxin n=1 Tax=unclassified Frankia TaxID=2632575 RepID=UPI002AD534EE|nr:MULTISPECIES: type II toxin-antitoxin system Phd/YefM family antitoxin [unclassified Frankia]
MYSSIVAESMPEHSRVPSLPFTEARARFTEVVGRAEYAKTPTIITKRGREVAVVMPIEALAYLLARTPEDTGRRSVAESVARLAALGEGTGLTHEQVLAAVRAVRDDAE